MVTVNFFKIKGLYVWFVLIFNYAYILCLSVCEYMHVNISIHLGQRDMTFLQLELGNCELPDMGTGNQKWVL